MKLYRLLIFACAFALFSCKNKPRSEENIDKKKPIEILKEPAKLNLSILLDLSDRIDTSKYHNEAMEFYLRDIGYIESISKSFVKHLSEKKRRIIKDKIALYFHPEPKNRQINKISKELRYNVNRHNVSTELFKQIQQVYQQKPKEIYLQALADGKYIGSDIWSFFKNKVEDYCIDEGYRNILIVLTDGYIYHKYTQIKEANRTSYLIPQDIRDNGFNVPTWKEKFDKKDFGFVAINKDLSNLEVLVLGINPDKKNPLEEDVIHTYWAKWFTEMNVQNFEVKQADLPSNMDKVIKNFILSQ